LQGRTTPREPFVRSVRSSAESGVTTEEIIGWTIEACRNEVVDFGLGDTFWRVCGPDADDKGGVPLSRRLKPWKTRSGSESNTPARFLVWPNWNSSICDERSAQDWARSEHVQDLSTEDRPGGHHVRAAVDDLLSWRKGIDSRSVTAPASYGVPSTITCEQPCSATSTRASCRSGGWACRTVTTSLAVAVRHPAVGGRADHRPPAPVPRLRTRWRSAARSTKRSSSAGANSTAQKVRSSQRSRQPDDLAAVIDVYRVGRGVRAEPGHGAHVPADRVDEARSHGGPDVAHGQPPAGRRALERGVR
jgi:hypothetical protein